MKKISITQFRILIFLIIFLLFTTSAFTAGTEEEVVRIEEYVAVLDLEARMGIGKDLALIISDTIRHQVVKERKFKKVIDRSNMDKIFEEQKFQVSGCITKECAVKAGRILGVGKIITGYITKFEKTCYISLSLINVETAEIENTAEAKGSCTINDLQKPCKRAACELIKAECIPPLIKNYIVVKGGLYSPKTKNNSQSFDSGYSGVIAYGYKLSPYIALEMEAGLLNTKGSTSNTCVSAGGASCAYAYDEKITVFPVTATLKAILPVKAIELYAGGGGGYYLIKDEMDVLLNSSKVASGSASAQSPAFHISGGLNINLGENLFLGIDGRYIFLEKVELEFSGNYAGKRNIDLTGYIINASLGIRF